MSEIKLLSCPFCGGEAKVETRFEEWYGRLYDVVYVFCTVCGCKSKDVMFEYKGLEDAKQKVISAWNNRKPVEEVLERLENNSYLCGPTYDIDGYSNGDEREVILLEIAVEIVREELGGE